MAEKIMEKYHSLLGATLGSTTDSIIIVNLDGKIVNFNQKYAHMWRIPDEFLESRDHNLVWDFVLEQLKDPEWFQEKVRENYRHPDVSSYDVVEFKDGRYFELYSQPQRLRGKIVGREMSFRDVTERFQAAGALFQAHEQLEIKVEERTAELKKANEQLQNEIAERIRAEEELKQRTRLAELNSDIGIALIQRESLQDILQKCAEVLVRHLDAAFARIWTLNQDENVLELQASAGMYTHINGTHSRIPVGKFKIGMIAAERQPHLTNAVIGDPRVHNQEWAAREGIVAFAGYPLIVSEQVVGVMAIFARQPIPDFTLQAMGTVSHVIALGIQRKQVELALKQAKQQLEIRVEQRTVELSKSEQRFHFLGEIIPQQVWTAQPDGSIDYVNQRVLDYFGRTDEQMLGWGWQDVIHPEDLPSCLERWSNSLATGESYETEFRLKRIADETYRWHIGRALPLLDKDGGIVAWFGTCTDIDEQKQIEATLKQAKEQLEIRVQERTAELQHSEAKYRSVVNNVKEVIFQTDAAGLLTFLNPVWTEITGFGINESLGTSLLNYVHADDQNAILDRGLWTRDVDNGAQPPLADRQLKIENIKSSFRHEFRCRTQANDYRWLEVFTSLTLGENNSIIGTSGVLNDITERRQAEIEVRKALAKEKELNDLKSRFISMASHDLRTPLTVIFLATDLLKNYGTMLTEDKKRHQLNKIQTAVKHMTLLLEDVLFLCKTESGRLEVAPVMLDLEEFCREILEEIEMTSEQNHTLVFDCQRRCQSGGCSVFQIDPKLLRQILSNLLSNAVKYSPQGGNVYFNLVCEDEQAIFQIRDEGIGIPASEQSHLFEAFHRASNVANISGTGLGMTIVKNAVELHGGSISFESEVGVGTTFIVCLPASQPFN